MKKFQILVFLLFTLFSSFSQTLRGTVDDYDTREKLEFVNIILQNKDSLISHTTSDKFGRFSFKNLPFGTYQLKAFFIGYDQEILDSIKIPYTGKEILISLGNHSNGGFICTETFTYICQENNPAYEYYLNNKRTINYTDSLGRRQGAWQKLYDRHKDPPSKFRHNQTIEMGYYKDDKKIGRWLFLNSNSKVNWVVTYDMDKVLNKNKCTLKNYPQGQ